MGVQTGWFSEVLLRSWKGMHLISVDPWLAAEADYEDIANVDQDSHDRLYATTCERLRPFGERSSVWRTDSLTAAGRIPDHSLDFAYLDARHDYPSVTEDITVWFPKVRPGGIIAGHDYLDGTRAEGVFAVESAVRDFFGPRGIPVASTYLDEPWDSWIAEVPRPGGGGSGLGWRIGSALRSGLVALHGTRSRVEGGD